MSPQDRLADLQRQITALRAADANVSAAARQLRQDGDALCATLPPRFGEVLHDLLDRLESSALFAEESCSFSRDGLLDNLDLWREKAAARLAAAAAG